VGGPRSKNTKTRANGSFRVVLALEDPRLREDLGAALREAGCSVHVLLCADDLADRVPAIDDVVLVIEHADWLRIVSDLLHDRPSTLPVALVDFGATEEFLSAVTAGVAGFCSPDAGVDAIVRTIESVRRTGVAVPRAMVGSLIEQVRRGGGHTVPSAAGAVDVTEREWEILQLLLQRRSTREMADELYVSVGTVRSHMSSVLKKLGAADRDDAIALIEGSRLDRTV